MWWGFSRSFPWGSKEGFEDDGGGLVGLDVIGEDSLFSWIDVVVFPPKK